MTTYVIALPPVDTRYTAQWLQWTCSFAATKPRGTIVPLSTKLNFKLNPTEFLDYRQYFSSVAPSIVAALRMLKSGDTVFFMDGETPGAEVFEYVRKMEGINVSIRAFWHAGTYDENDLTFKRGVGGEAFERGWFSMTEKVYVGSEYHKRLLHQTRDVPLDKVTVTGCPLDLAVFEDGQKTPKTRKFLYVGRKTDEKGYDIVQNLRRDGVPITASMEEGWDKKRFYHELAASEMIVNPARQETFGIGMMEAFASNVPVIVPNTPQFQTTVPDKYRVDSHDFLSKPWFLDSAARVAEQAGNEREIVSQYDYHNVMEKWFT